MIIAKMTDGSLLLGLSERNIELLRKGKPIVKDVEGLAKFVIVYGKTEGDIMAELKAHGLVHPNVQTHLL
jgi:hypothetical protein